MMINLNPVGPEPLNRLRRPASRGKTGVDVFSLHLSNEKRDPGNLALLGCPRKLVNG